MENKAKNIYFFLTALIILLAANFWAADYQTLTGDEIFYFFQAKEILHGNFLWLQDASSYSFPVILSPLSFSLLAIRLFMTVISATSATLFFSYVWKISNLKTAIIAGLLLLLHPQFLHMSFSLFAEPLFLLLLFGYLLLWIRPIKKTFSVQTVLLTIVLFLLLLTKTAGIILPAALFLTTLFRKNSDKKKRILVLMISSSIAVLLFTIFPILINSTILQEKISAHDWPGLIIYFKSAPKYFLESFLGISLIGLFLLKWKENNHLFPIIFSVLYIATMALFVSPFFYRYFFLIIPFFALIAAIGIVRISKKTQITAIIILATFLIQSFFSLGILKDRFTNNYYLSKENCKNLETFESSCTENPVQLPYFDQSNDSSCTYSYALKNNKQFNTIFASYVDDYGNFFLDGNYIGKNESPLRETILPVEINPGKHTISIEINNTINIGGIGQIMICE